MQGGLTFFQLEGLYHNIQIIKLREFKIQASLHGAEIKGERSTKEMAQEHENVPLFRDPSEYEAMTQEDRDKETQRMMGLHKRWSGDALKKEPKL